MSVASNSDVKVASMKINVGSSPVARETAVMLAFFTDDGDGSVDWASASNALFER